MEIVPMKREHTAALAELEKQCFSRPWSQKALEDELYSPTAFFIVAVEGEQILGYGGMHCCCGECYVDNIAVFAQYRRRGVGAALVGELLAQAKRQGGEFLSLEVRPSNLAAVHLYTKLGFVEEGRRKEFYNAPREDALIFTKRLLSEQ